MANCLHIRCEPYRRCQLHYRDCPAAHSGDVFGVCECVQIERDMRADWVDAGMPDDWDEPW